MKWMEKKKHTESKLNTKVEKEENKEIEMEKKRNEMKW